MASPRPPLARPPLVVGVLLLGLAAVIARDALASTFTAAYGMGPTAMSYVVAAGLAVLGLAHLVKAFTGGFGDSPDAIDVKAVLWVSAGLLALIAGIGFNLGFIPAMTALFFCTSCGFGRRAYAVDFAIGLGLALVIYLAFTRLLTLGLPQGPLERLLG